MKTSTIVRQSIVRKSHEFIATKYLLPIFGNKSKTLLGYSVPQARITVKQLVLLKGNNKIFKAALREDLK